MCVVIVSLVLEFVLSLLHREVLRTSSCFRFVLASRRLEFDKKSKILNQPLDTSIVLFFEVSRGPIRIFTFRCPEV